MDDPVKDLQRAIAHRRYELTGVTDADINWREAGKIILHFVERRPESLEWKQDHEDFMSLYGDLIYGDRESDKRADSTRSETDCGCNQSTSKRSG